MATSGSRNRKRQAVDTNTGLAPVRPRGADHRLFNPVRACTRGLAVLEAINALRAAGIMDIVKATHLPRTTVIRLVETLQDEGYILKDHATATFEPAPRVIRLSQGLNLDAWLVTVTTPKLKQLLDTIGWPSDITVLQGDRMALRNSNRGYSPLNIDRHYAGMTSALVTGASGRAYLAWCPEPERAKLISMTTKYADRAALTRELEKTRERGYSIRSPDIEPRIGAIAIPVLVPDFVLCCITCVFPPEAMSTRQIAARSLRPMQSLAAEIAEEYKRTFCP